MIDILIFAVIYALLAAGNLIRLVKGPTGADRMVAADSMDILVASEGNGLGLALVRKIVAAAHGTINVTSSEDAGTEFVVALPNSSSDS